MAAAYHVAQLNIGRLRAPLDSPQVEGFVSALEPINELADRAPGFVWRLQTEEGDATALRPFEDDDMLLVNMSVWESLETLSEFAYRSDHRRIMAGRRQWFERMSEAYLVLWWVPAGHVPTVEEAKERLMILREKGPTPEAFTFRHSFPPPDQLSEQDESDRVPAARAGAGPSLASPAARDVHGQAEVAAAAPRDPAGDDLRGQAEVAAAAPRDPAGNRARPVRPDDGADATVASGDGGDPSLPGSGAP